MAYPGLKEILASSSFVVQEGTFVYAKVATRPQKGMHFLVTQDQEEITVVTKREQLPELELLERNKEDYTLIALNVSVPFYSVGFLAAVSSALAQKRLNILIISTYSKDYLLVRHEDLPTARKPLLSLGMREQ